MAALEAERKRFTHLPGPPADSSCPEGRAFEEDTFSFVPSPCSASTKTSKAWKVFDDGAKDTPLDLSEQERLDIVFLTKHTKICVRWQ